jgi:hypothetical protein
MGLGSGIRKKPIADPGVKKAPDPGVKKAQDPGSRIRNTECIVLDQNKTAENGNFELPVILP